MDFILDNWLAIIVVFLAFLAMFN